MTNYTNDKIVIKGKKLSLSTYIFLLGLAIFLIYLIFLTIKSPRVDNLQKVLMILTFLLVSFFIFGGMHLFRINSRLILTKKGFTIKDFLHSYSRRWEDIEIFYIAKFGKVELIVFKFQNSYKKRKTLKAFLKVSLLIGGESLDGGDDGFANRYEIETKKLLDLLNEWQEKYSKINIYSAP